MYGTERRIKQTVPLLRARKGGAKLAALTAYDHGFAALMDHAGIDALLVGDSLGMVVQGQRSTLAVSIEDMVYHTRAVASGVQSALVITDLPFLSYADGPTALASARRVVAAGAEMVKLEGAGVTLDVIKALSDRDVPVCAHLGLTPQSVHKLGGFKVQGRKQAAAERLLQDARAVEQAGAELLVLECVPSTLAARITAEVSIPTIGIGAGAQTDGQILVLHDVLGVTAGRRPRFVRNFLEGQISIEAAVQAYIAAVRDGSFPGKEHGYEMDPA